MAGGQPIEGLEACRLYKAAGKPAGVPAVESIVDALIHAKKRDAVQAGSTVPGSPEGWRRSWLVFPSLGVALLPTACPACWPAYAALVSGLGLSFLLSEGHLFVLTAGLVGLAIGALGIRVSRRRGYLRFFIGLFAGVLILVGKFVMASDAILFAGMTLLAGASVWKALPLPRLAGGCAACTGRGEAAKEKTTGR
ncbi:MAG: hypothetical protein L0387_24685 [Acidobacteria bacterium]|nr:hypothetical protein [Acidobacteriota bacterium]MCI0719087.1 hypothetical protein [Acidobacteriota bacterium]